MSAGMADAPLESARYWISQVELFDTVAFIRRRGFKRVALQFPDELLAASPAVAAALSEACNRQTPIPNPILPPRSEQEAKPALHPPNPSPKDRVAIAELGAQQGTISAAEDGPVRIFVLADTTYGSCCVDEVAAAHVDAQCVVHFGRACLSPTSRLRARFVFGTAPLDVRHCSAQILDLARTKSKPLLVLFGLEYAHAIPQLREALEPSDADVRFADLPSTEMEPASCSSQDGALVCIEAPSRADPETAQEAPAQVQVTRDETRGDSGQGDESVEESSAMWSNGSITGSMGEKLSSSEPEVSIQNESTPPGDAAAERFRSSTGAESSGASEEFRSGGLTWRLKRTEKMTDVVVAWVGGEGPALTDVMLTHNQCEVVRYDPSEKRLLTDVADNSRFLRRRYYLVERAKNASIVGIVVGTLSSAGYLTVIKRLRSIISAAGKKSYTFVMGKPNPAKLANFPECEVFVLVACPQTALLDSKEYLSPVITPFEAELAFSQKRAWTGEYRLDFSGLRGLEAGNGVVQEDGSGDEDDEPRFSLVSGAYEPGSVVRGSQEGETSSAVALVSNDVRALQVSEGAGALTTFGGRKHESGAKSGAEYLVSKRTYQGLSVPQYMRQENGTQAGGSEKSTPVVTAVKGRSGRAAGYSDEK